MFGLEFGLITFLQWSGCFLDSFWEMDAGKLLEITFKNLRIVLLWLWFDRFCWITVVVFSNLDLNMMLGTDAEAARDTKTKR